ncbi:helix-turn-helix domain-containing protein [Neobacillus cucumis]|nr:helix-turn-helix domain-containing protein [Neobacillus cucumis]WHY89779.1 helix-turn-helix domain-containing protein [Neobacillus cucumis]WHY90771.1 helix-turn-helix domain-containing protein [Neobacillus cucumis]WHY92170.1 helix-turn-helix domain-containing protein [Neobacillus cucumis]WHY93875.1 helix-turn-helix domain-containing protein [Neobacillus cucumis]
MAKYSKEFKLMVVKEYKEGSLGHKLLAKKHGVKAYSQIKRWIDVYEKFGEEGLKRKIHKETYSVQFKLDVLSFMKRTGSSETETALHFGLANPPIIGSWKKAFLEGGTEALDRPKGRPSMSDKAKNGNYKKTTEENKMTYEQKLERENELLRLEVEYLKKLRAFQMNPEGYLEKHKQRYHSNSKKPSN